MNAPKSNSLIDQIEAALNELRPSLGLGPVTKDLDVDGTPMLAVPLVAGLRPAHPTLLAIAFDETQVAIGVHWIDMISAAAEIERLLGSFKRRRRISIRSAGVLLALSVLATNEPSRRSSAGVDIETGEIYVKLHIHVVDGVIVGLKDGLVSLIKHSNDVRQLSTFFWSNGFEFPPIPESPFRNEPTDLGGE